MAYHTCVLAFQFKCVRSGLTPHLGAWPAVIQAGRTMADPRPAPRGGAAGDRFEGRGGGAVCGWWCAKVGGGAYSWGGGAYDGGGAAYAGGGAYTGAAGAAAGGADSASVNNALADIAVGAGGAVAA